MDRRDFLRNTALAGMAVAAGGLGVLTFRAEREPTEPALPPAALVHPETQRPVRASDLPVAAPSTLLTVWHGEPVVVYRLPLEVLRAAALLRGFDTTQFAVAHPDDPDAALLAYHGKCKHLGCTVGWADHLGASSDVGDYDGDGVPDGRVLCPCHQAQYDVYDLGTHLPETPAPEPLDPIPLALEVDSEGSESPVLVGLRRIAQARPHAADERGRGAAPTL